MDTGNKIGHYHHVGKRLLTVREVATYLCIQEDTVYRMSRLRELPSVKVGRALRFDIKQIDAYIESNSKMTL